MAFIDSDKQTQFVSGLILSLCGFILFWELQKKSFTGTKLFLFRIGFSCAFIVFCINIYTIYAISKHISIVYDMLTVKDEDEVYDYHMSKNKKLNIITTVFRFSLALLVFSVFMMIISKHDIVDHRMIWLYTLITLSTILVFLF